MARWIWPAGHSSSTPGLDHSDLKYSWKLQVVHSLVKSFQPRIFDFSSKDLLTSIWPYFLSLLSSRQQPRSWIWKWGLNDSTMSKSKSDCLAGQWFKSESENMQELKTRSRSFLGFKVLRWQREIYFTLWPIIYMDISMQIFKHIMCVIPNTFIHSIICYLLLWITGLVLFL